MELSVTFSTLPPSSSQYPSSSIPYHNTVWYGYLYHSPFQISKEPTMLTPQMNQDLPQQSFCTALHKFKKNIIIMVPKVLLVKQQINNGKLLTTNNVKQYNHSSFARPVFIQIKGQEDKGYTYIILADDGIVQQETTVFVTTRRRIFCWSLVGIYQ